VTLGDFILNVVTIERAVTDERYDWTRRLVEQSAAWLPVHKLASPSGRIRTLPGRRR